MQLLRTLIISRLRISKKPRVGVVGEILVKFMHTANNHIIELLEAEGAEAVMPDLMGFLLYCMQNSTYKHELLKTPKKGAILSSTLIKILETFQKGWNQGTCRKQEIRCSI